ncbi:MAG: hypothetical protein V1870_05825 [Candidatus Aenigmatarchaeota archaeon]
MAKNRNIVNLSKDALKEIERPTSNELIDVLTDLGIPSSLLFRFSDGSFSLYSNVAQALSYKTSTGWRFTLPAQQQLTKTMEIINEKYGGDAELYATISKTAYYDSINSIFPKKRQNPIIISPLNLNGDINIIPNCVYEGGIEQAFKDVSGMRGGLIGIVGGFDFLASIAANGDFTDIVGIDINPYQILAGTIRAALCEISETQYKYIANLLSLDYYDDDFCGISGIDEFLAETSHENPSEYNAGITWDKLVPILSREKSASMHDFQKVWNKIFEMYANYNVYKKSVLSGDNINKYIRDFQEITLRHFDERVSWLASTENYNRVKNLVEDGRIVITSGDISSDAIDNAMKYLRGKDVQTSAIYISNLRAYLSPEKALDLDSKIAYLKDAGIYVTAGWSGRGARYGLVVNK